MRNKLNRLKSTVFNTALNLPGWRTGKKIVVIESDDWGSIRMPSKEVYKEFIQKGFDIINSEYNRLDTLESNNDLELLFEVLRSVSNRDREHPVMTANCIVGNPDFSKIKNAKFQQYFFEPVTHTLNNYPGRDRVLELWKKGNEERLFHPQFHGREHVNFIRWINALQKDSDSMMFTFSKGTTFSGKGDYNFMEVLDYNSKYDLVMMRQSLREGLILFKELFGYNSKSFIPPCYTWDSNIEEELAEQGVLYLQGIFTQLVPTGSFGNYRKKYHFLGQKNKFDQIFLMRNVFFEPSLSNTNSKVDDCMRRINLAFRYKKPAIIGTHRINYMGELDQKNRSGNLLLFKELLRKITKQWPDVVFMTSDELGDYIRYGDMQ